MAYGNFNIEMDREDLDILKTTFTFSRGGSHQYLENEIEKLFKQ
jgi:hypothetical protein